MKFPVLSKGPKGFFKWIFGPLTFALDTWGCGAWSRCDVEGGHIFCVALDCPLVFPF
ncbi:MAG: hypothetical protein Ct9H300mP19_08110 [Dehalococcoidia bacterium]|nr:MAG: hypothetical protein Ct9H300mP19_08110 [Dehalococcoidia bacterium]